MINVKEWGGAVVFISITIAIGVWLLILSNERTSVLMYVGDCVDKHASAEGFIGESEDKWNAFVNKCFNEYRASRTE